MINNDEYEIRKSPKQKLIQVWSLTTDYSLILWLSFFCRSRTSAIESSSGSCFMRISSASSFSNFSASSKSSSKLRISSIKSFDFVGFVIDYYREFTKKQKTSKVAMSIYFYYATAVLRRKKVNSVSMANYLILSSTGI